jgi:hypothetical protein
LKAHLGICEDNLKAVVFGTENESIKNNPVSLSGSIYLNFVYGLEVKFVSAIYVLNLSFQSKVVMEVV